MVARWVNRGYAGNGVSARSNNAVSGSTRGSLNLYQNAYCGQWRGDRGRAGAPGLGGGANSMLTVNDLMAKVSPGRHHRKWWQWRVRTSFRQFGAALQPQRPL